MGYDAQKLQRERQRQQDQRDMSLQEHVHAGLDKAKYDLDAAKKRLATLSQGEEGSLMRETYNSQVSRIDRLRGRIMTLAEIAVRIEDEGDDNHAR